MFHVHACTAVVPSCNCKFHLQLGARARGARASRPTNFNLPRPSFEFRSTGGQLHFEKDFVTVA